MPLTKCELPHPLLEKCYGDHFLNTELNKPHLSHDEMIFMHCSLQIKQNTYSKCIFHAPVVTHFIVKA